MAVSPGIALNTVFLLVDLAFNEALGTGGGGGAWFSSSCPPLLGFCGALACRGAMFKEIRRDDLHKIQDRDDLYILSQWRLKKVRPR